MVNINLKRKLDHGLNARRIEGTATDAMIVTTIMNKMVVVDILAAKGVCGKKSLKIRAPTAIKKTTCKILFSIFMVLLLRCPSC